MIIQHSLFAFNRAPLKSPFWLLDGSFFAIGYRRGVSSSTDLETTINMFVSYGNAQKCERFGRIVSAPAVTRPMNLGLASKIW